jgi:hypothetical protein
MYKQLILLSVSFFSLLAVCDRGTLLSQGLETSLQATAQAGL